jgi:undecaprenyl-diphosphatase
MRFITESGGSIAIVVLCLSLFLFPKTRKDWALPVSTTVVIATTSNLVLKLIFARERPDIMRLIDEYNYSFPSGHAMINMAFYIIILLLTWRHVPNKSAKYALTFICIIMPLIIGFSRIYLGVHYATDVIAGWLLGFSVAVIVYSWFYRGKNEV